VDGHYHENSDVSKKSLVFATRVPTSGGLCDGRTAVSTNHAGCSTQQRGDLGQFDDGSQGIGPHVPAYTP